MSKADDKYIDMEVALTDEWLKQGKLRELTFADAIEYGYKQAKVDVKAEIERLRECVGKASSDLYAFTDFMKGELNAYEEIEGFIED